MVLIDTDKERLSYSKGVGYASAILSFESSRLEDIEEDILADLMVISNTLLEFEPDDEFFRCVVRHMSKGATLLVFLPDILADVMDNYVAGNRLALSNFRSGVHSITKRDKFTLSETNFYAHRLIILAQSFTKFGLSLKNVRISQTSPEYFELEFVK